MFIDDLESTKNCNLNENRGGKRLPGPPVEGNYKIHVDVIVSRWGEVDAAVGAVFRDHAGQYLGASDIVSRGFTRASVLDAAACSRGLILAFRCDFE